MTQGEQLIVASMVVLLFLFFFIWKIERRARIRPARSPLPLGTEKWAIIDGSNVMYWKGGEPQIDTVCKVIETLVAKGFTPGVMFDANAGYLLTGKYQHDDALSRALGIPQDRVMVVPKGTPADPAILTAARDYKARVVTNDRFRDWAHDFPEIRKPGYLIRGEFKSGTLMLGLNPKQNRRKKRKPRAG